MDSEGAYEELAAARALAEAGLLTQPPEPVDEKLADDLYVMLERTLKRFVGADEGDLVDFVLAATAALIAWRDRPRLLRDEPEAETPVCPDCGKTDRGLVMHPRLEGPIFCHDPFHTDWSARSVEPEGQTR